MTTDQIFGQKGKVWYQEQQDIVSSSSWKKRIRKRKFYPFFSERVFSAAGNTVTPKRANLNPEKVEDLVVVQSNLQLLKSMGMRH